MNNGDGTKIKNAPVTRNALVVAIVSSVLASTSAPFLLVRIGINPFRPDGYTSVQADTHRSEDERRFAALERHIQNHPDDTGKFDSRIGILEAQYDIIIANQRRILDRLDRAN